MAAASLPRTDSHDSSDCENEHEDDDTWAAIQTLLLPPHWSREELKTKGGGIMPLISIVVDEPAEQVHLLVADSKSHAHASPNNVAAICDAFALPALSLGAA
jgi:hypothetical protein